MAVLGRALSYRAGSAGVRVAAATTSAPAAGGSLCGGPMALCANSSSRSVSIASCALPTHLPAAAPLATACSPCPSRQPLHLQPPPQQQRHTRGLASARGVAALLGQHRGPVPARSGNGQVGPPERERKKGHGAGGKKGDKAAGAATAVAAPPASLDDHEVGEGGAGPALDELEELDEEAGQQLAPFMDAVVKVYCIHTEPNYSLPWQRKRQYSSSSSGFVVRHGGRNWLLTNAHSVDYHTQVKVKLRGDDRKFLARVLSVGVDCDVAALQVDDPAFWEGVTPLELGPLPRLQDGVAVVGYPIGGDTISVTAGVVSRIEVTDYSHGSTDLLAIQIDAAINGGNSGGPVFNRACQCVGIAFQALVGSDVENVGYVIPTPVVTHFLDDYTRTGTFSGFPALGVQWQRMESDALRRAYGMAPGQKGVLIRSVNPTSAAASVLRPDDVLLSFDGTPISNDGTVPFRTGERIAFSYLISNKFVGDTAQLEVLRGGNTLSLSVTLSKPSALVPPHLSNRDPPYLLVGGLVFVTASEPYLQSEYGAEYGSDAPVKILDRLYHGFPDQPDQEVVVLSQVLACDATLGYEDVYNVQLLRLNGTPVRNLRHLAELVAAAQRQAREDREARAAEGAEGGAAPAKHFLRFDLEYNEVVVIEVDGLGEVTPEVMRSHSIPHPMSADLRAAVAGAGQGAADGQA